MKSLSGLGLFLFLVEFDLCLSLFLASTYVLFSRITLAVRVLGINPVAIFGFVAPLLAVTAFVGTFAWGVDLSTDFVYLGYLSVLSLPCPSC